MSKEACIIKGTRHGVSISIPAEMEFSEALAQLRARLASAQEFFTGATVHLLTDDRELAPAEKQKLEETVEEFGLKVQTKINHKRPKPPVKKHNSGENENSVHPEEDTLLLRRTLRSGQKLRYDGNVVVVGDINPGAEIVCTGDILVLGSLRGVAHAGCNGNTSSTVIAFRLEPTQLRIANYISRSPDEKLPQPLGPEIARVTENVIQISAYS